MWEDEGGIQTSFSGTSRQASQASRWLTLQEPTQRNDPGTFQMYAWNVGILNSSLKARLPRLCQVGLMTMAGPAPWEHLEDEEMVGKQMWALETAHETELRDTQRTYISDALAHFEEARCPTHKAIACAPAKYQAFEQCSACFSWCMVVNS